MTGPLLFLAIFWSAPAAAGHPGGAVAPHAGEAPVIWLDTADGAQVAVQHHATPGGPPVVLCHGISSNHHFWDLGPGRSLALYLQERGFDVYNADLRGHGFALHDREGRRQHAGWSIDDYGRYDLPAILDYARAESGAPEVSFVGHSMGGMVLAVYLATHADPGLASAVVVSSPLDFRDPDAVMRTLLGQSWLGQVTPFLPTPTGAAMLAGWDEKAPFAMDEYLYNPENIADPGVRKDMVRRVASPLSRGEIRQFSLARRDGEFVSEDGERVYRESLHEVAVPMLFLAGRADRVVNPDRVWTYYESVGSPQKAFVVASVANGFSHDYGHLDYGVGDHAATEVFPVIADWLARWR